MLWFTSLASASAPVMMAWAADLERPACHREAVEGLRQAWPALTDAERAAVLARTPLWPQRLPPPPADAPSCTPQQGDHQLLTPHFVVEWDDAAADPARAEAVGEALEHAWQRLFGELGWREPNGSDTWRISVYLTADPFDGGYTTEVDCDGAPVPTFVIGNGTFDYGTWYQDVAAHELHHASHYQYGRAFDNWWWEATAIWVQEHVFPDNNEWAYYVDFYVANPQWSLGTTSYSGDEARHMYGSALWVFWLEQSFGGHDHVRSLWERSAALPANQRATMPDVLAPEVDFASTFIDFAHQLPVRGVGEGELYATPRATVVDALPSSGRPIGWEEPQPWGMYYVQFVGEALPAKGLLVEVTAEEPSLDVALLGVRDGQIAETVRGANPLRLAVAHTFDEAWLVAVAAGGDGPHSVSWSASEAPPDAEPEPPAAADPAPEASGCGCATGLGSSAGWWLVGGLAWRRRRCPSS